MEAKAYLRYARISPRKVKIVLWYPDPRQRRCCCDGYSEQHTQERQRVFDQVDQKRKCER